MKVKRIISKIIRHHLLFNFWVFVKRISLYGLNYGVASGLPEYSGENFIIKSILKKIDSPIIFDVGSNVGDWTSSVLNFLYKKKLMIYLIEPSTESFKQLNNKFSENKNISIHKIGFNDIPRTLEISYDYPTEGSSGVFNSGKFKEEISTTTLDDFCIQNKIEKIDFIKMDVQGLEFNILKGAINLINSNKLSVIQFEIDAPSIDNRVFFKDFWDLLSEKYFIYHSLYNGLKKIEKYDPGLEIFLTMNYVAIQKNYKIL